MASQDQEVRKLLMRYAKEAVGRDAQLIDLQFERFRNGWVATVKSRKEGVVEVVGRIRGGQWEFERGPGHAQPRRKGPSAYARAGVDNPVIFALKGLIGVGVIVGLVVMWPQYGPRVQAIANQVGAMLPRMNLKAPTNQAADEAIEGLQDLKRMQQNPGQ